MHKVAILDDLSDAPDVEDSLSAQPDRRLLSIRMILNTDCNVNMTAI
jgi:hypothetical protein